MCSHEAEGETTNFSLNSLKVSHFSQNSYEENMMNTLRYNVPTAD